ncbi:MAG: Hsp70 family protein [Isosphaeraceae bacterium]
MTLPSSESPRSQPSGRPRYIVGIDLGTTNCAVAYVDTRGRERPTADIKVFEVPQLVAAGETAPRSMLPSFLYLPGPHELPPDAAHLPWRNDADRIVGEFARIQGARVPGHLVSSAKSWLCHAGVDREADILPWGSPPEARRVSPVDASAEYLKHIRDAWNHDFASGDSSHRLEHCEIVLTVPASFDEAARELTLQAARRAGLERITLLEEPQAAFYCWIVGHQDSWQKEVRAGELILVCDIGGGTSDFSLITVVETPIGPGFRRVAVGDHLMLGGDNMDLALAHTVEQKMGGVRLDTEQWSALRSACRTAKEKLLGDDLAAQRWPVTIAGRGSRIIGGSIQSELTREEVEQVVLGGFYPESGPLDEPTKGAKLGFQEFGLPFVADPAIPRHLSAFLRRHQASPIAIDGPHPTGPARPDSILFNGGALTPSIVRDRIVSIVRGWFQADNPGYSPRVLSNTSLDLAVAIGAAYYGVVRRGGGIRIGGGTARSFYIGFEAESHADRPWLCVVPRDAQEGEEIRIGGHDFDLLMGQPVAFPLASSSVRPQDCPGDLVPTDPDSIRPLPPLRGLMRVGRKAKAERVPVQLEAKVTEIGTVELWCKSRTDERRWRLEIQFRTAATGGSTRAAPGGTMVSREADPQVLEQSLVDDGVAAIQSAFGPSPPADRGPSRLIRRLEEVLEIPREQWPPSALRSFWDPLLAAMPRRQNSPQVEARWLNLAGYFLRPGIGFPMDEGRIKSLWPAFHAGVKHTKDVQCWAEWWILWRRVAAGLNRSHHEEIHRRLAPFLMPNKGGAGKKLPRPKPEAHELAEMWRCAAALERLSDATKQTLGEALLREIRGPIIPGYGLWSLGRLGARIPLFGQANTAVHAETAANWATSLLEREFAPGRESNDAIFALSTIGRVSGDRARDLDPALRERITARLQAMGADETTIRPVREFHELEAGQTAQALGDSLPVGLRLIASESARAE